MCVCVTLSFKDLVKHCVISVKYSLSFLSLSWLVSVPLNPTDVRCAY